MPIAPVTQNPSPQAPNPSPAPSATTAAPANEITLVVKPALTAEQLRMSPEELRRSLVKTGKMPDTDTTPTLGGTTALMMASYKDLVRQAEAKIGNQEQAEAFVDQKYGAAVERIFRETFATVQLKASADVQVKRDLIEKIYPGFSHPDNITAKGASEIPHYTAKQLLWAVCAGCYRGSSIEEKMAFADAVVSGNYEAFERRLGKDGKPIGKAVDVRVRTAAENFLRNIPDESKVSVESRDGQFAGPTQIARTLASISQHLQESPKLPDGQRWSTDNTKTPRSPATYGTSPTNPWRTDGAGSGTQVETSQFGRVMNDLKAQLVGLNGDQRRMLIENTFVDYGRTRREITNDDLRTFNYDHQDNMILTNTEVVLARIAAARSFDSKNPTTAQQYMRDLAIVEKGPWVIKHPDERLTPRTGNISGDDRRAIKEVIKRWGGDASPDVQSLRNDAYRLRDLRNQAARNPDGVEDSPEKVLRDFSRPNGRRWGF